MREAPFPRDRQRHSDAELSPALASAIWARSGFGNGMLLSTQTKLLGAFNHMHIFCDPDPNPVKSFASASLFNEVKGWSEYNKALLSKGGRFILRSEKT